MLFLNRIRLLWAMGLIQFLSVKALFTGDGTMYGGNANGGACGFQKSWPAWTNEVKAMTAAINMEQWEDATNCGRCASVTYKNRPPVIIQFTDACPECIKGAVDLAPAAWSSVLGLTPGRETISWDFVECPSTFVNGNLFYVIKEGSNDHWCAFQPQNFAVGIRKVSIKQAGSTNWEVLERDESTLNGFYFVYKGLLKGSFQLASTSVHGEEIISPVFESLQAELKCKVQFNSFNTKSYTKSKGPIVNTIPIFPPKEASESTPKNPGNFLLPDTPISPIRSEPTKVHVEPNAPPSGQVKSGISGNPPFRTGDTPDRCT